MAKTKEARLQKTKFNSIGVPRQYHTQKGGLENETKDRLKSKRLAIREV